ncbi:hypothetical protein ACFYON_01955 [Micromonospora sp. NPDC005686]|uniref:hypothetical protein n=1 Tax=unclassified Micromonospora TaxID=2617518 RepID=UPI0033A8DB89
MSVTGSIEVCLSLWTADVLRTHAGLSAGGASAAVAAIVCGMFAGRLAVAGPAADKAAGWSAYSMGVGFGIAPVALGWVADGVGPHPAFLLLPAFIAVAVLLTVRLGRALRPAALPA